MLRMASLDGICQWFYYVFIRGKDKHSEGDLSRLSIIGDIPIRSSQKDSHFTDGDHLLTREGPEKSEAFIHIDHRNWAKINTSLHRSKFATVHHVVSSLWVG